MLRMHHCQRARRVSGHGLTWLGHSTFFETKEIREQILDTKDPVVPPVVLVGNKLDLADERTVKREQGESQVCVRLRCQSFDACSLSSFVLLLLC